MRGLAVVLLCACGRLGFEATSSDAGGDGDSGIEVACNLAGRVTDTFEDGVIDDFLWGSRYADPGATLVEANGTLTFTLASTAASTYAGIKSLRFYDMRGQRLIVDVVQVPAMGANAGIQIEYANDRYISLSVIGGSLRAAYKLGPFVVVGSVPYVPSEHRFWAIAEDAGTIHYETSLDGVSFTTFATLPSPFDVSLVRQTAFAGTDMVVAAPGAFVIESIGPATPVASVACAASSLVDTFDDGVISHVWERSYANACCTLEEMGGEMVIAYDGTVGTTSLRSASGLDLRDDAVTIHITQEPTRSGTSLSLTLRFDNDNVLELGVSPVMTSARQLVNGVSDTVTAPRDATESYLRIRETGGAYVMEVSTDRTTWRTLRSETAPFPLDDVLIAIRGGITTAGTAGQVASFDDVNAP